MARLFKIIVFLWVFIFSCTQLSTGVYASTQLDLIPPSGTLKRGDDVQFTITIDTGGAAVSTLQVGLEYDSAVLQYLNTTPGDTYQTISATPLNSKQILISASNPVGTSSQGNLAYVEFKIIADAPGETELCALFLPEATPGPSPTPGPSTVAPSSLPVTGEDGNGPTMIVMGAALLVVAGTFFVAGQTIFFKPRKKL